MINTEEKYLVNSLTQAASMTLEGLTERINHLRLADRNHYDMMGRFSRVMSI